MTSPIDQRKVACPKCAAKVDEPCIGVHGQVLNMHHHERWRAYCRRGEAPVSDR